MNGEKKKKTTEEVSMTVKLHTGAQVNVLRLHTLKKVNNQFQVKPTSVKLKTLDGVITPVGKLPCCVKLKGLMLILTSYDATAGKNRPSNVVCPALVESISILVIYLDDLLCMGETEATHNEPVRQVVEKA
ncbi:hypothetical protein PR048_032690 [Dryococelus australis]|uniref:Reverse transcriptase domain-containing protein n=1 Tax=Dryococelus australis TaxID=614101 RepID=A0ABQ9G2X2_9NEOP|nr:hypothetical protein PR048_032690 [Dryococelus australis]